MKKINSIVAAATLAVATHAASAGDSIKLYTLDCGAVDVADMAPFDDKGRFDGQSTVLANPCFLIRHPKGDLLWDTGMEQSLADIPEGIGDNFHFTAKRKLTDQLADLGLGVADIDFLSISHWHPDHSGNAGLFAASTWIVNRTERAFMFAEEKPQGSEDYIALEDAKTIQFDATHDVFGDGSAVITSLPGHTPGHSILTLKLDKAGTLMFSGDLHIFAEGRKVDAIPTFNFDAEATVPSLRRFAEMAKKENARVIIQHEKADFDALPKFPKYLD